MKYLIFIFMAGVLVLFSGCAKYEQFAFAVPYEQPTVTDQVEVRTHLLNSYERQNLFCTNPSYFARKYEAIQIHIYNNSNEEYRLAGTNISLPLETYNKVRKKLEKNDLWNNCCDDPVERQLRNHMDKEQEERIKYKTINRDSLIKISAGLSYTGILLVRRGNFSSDFTIKLVDKHNRRPIYFDLYV